MASKEIKPKYHATSDLHIGHKNILKYCPNRHNKQPFSSIQEHDEELVKRWNSVVAPHDIVIVGGDVKICGQTYAKGVIARLNGKKILVRGNHDEGAKKMMRLGFDWVCEQMLINVGGHIVLVSHYPWRIPWYKQLFYRAKQLFYKREIYDFREMKKRPIKRKGVVLWYGHTHQTKMVNVNDMSIHIGLDSANMYPLSEDFLCSLMSNMKKGKKDKVKNKGVK
jgi:calcineurin-like phosphoesterase family protein